VPSEKWLDKGLTVELVVHGNFWKSRNALYLISLIIILVFITVIYFVSRHFRQNIIKVKTRLSLKTIHLKEAKQTNIELQKELSNKSNEIDYMLNELSDNTKQLNSIEFRDATTGLYRLDSIRRLLSDKLKDSSSLSFDLIMSLHISNHEKLDAQHGEICSAELSHFVASELKNTVSANTYICHINDNQFILFSNTDKNADQLNNLINFRDRLARTQISIANGLTVQTNIGMAYLDLYPEKITNIKSIVGLSKIIIQVQNNAIPNNSAALLRIDLNELIDSYQDRYTNIEEQLVNTNKITIHQL